MALKNIEIYGAGLSGLVSAITLAKNEYNVIVYEKEKNIGGTLKCHPSVHMTPVHLQKMQEYIGIEIESCFSELDDFRGYIGNDKYEFSTENLYVVERGPRKTSLDYFLYKIALENGVNFEFSNPLTASKLKDLSENSIIATAGYSQIVKDLNLPYVTFKQFDIHMKSDFGNITIVYFGDYTSDYGYISSKNGILSAQISGPLNLSQNSLDKFTNLVKKTEGINLEGWSSIISHFPKKVRLFTKFAGKNLILAGDIAGFLDPFFGFGINGALISGKIAALGVVSKQKALHDLNQSAPNLSKHLLMHTFYWHLPFKKIFQTQIMKFHKNDISLFKHSIPGFIDEDWLKIISIKNIY